jgi:hypothetical protein
VPSNSTVAEQACVELPEHVTVATRVSPDANEIGVDKVKSSGVVDASDIKNK